MVGTFKTGALSVSTIVHMWVQRNKKLGQFCDAWSKTSLKAQVRGGHGSVKDLGSFPPVFMGGGGVGGDAEVVIYVPRSGCDTVSIGWTSVNMICGVGVGLGGLKYHNRMPKVNLERFGVAMNGLLTIP